MPCERRYDAGPFGKISYTNRLYQPHGDVTPAILPNAPRNSVCCTCVEYPTRNIAARLALTKRPPAGPAAVGGLNHWRALEWPVQLPYRFSTETPVFPDTSPRSANFRCWNPSRNTCSPNAGASMTIATRHITLSPAISGSWPRSPWAIAATDGDFRGLSRRQCRPDAGGE